MQCFPLLYLRSSTLETQDVYIEYVILFQLPEISVVFRAASNPRPAQNPTATFSPACCGFPSFRRIDFFKKNLKKTSVIEPGLVSPSCLCMWSGGEGATFTGALHYIYLELRDRESSNQISRSP